MHAVLTLQLSELVSGFKTYHRAEPYQQLQWKAANTMKHSTWDIGQSN